MKKIILAENLHQYQFLPRAAGQHFGFNIYALIHAKDALLIDTAFEENACAVQDDLAAAGVAPAMVVISHFHEDHFSGLGALPGLPVWGSGDTGGAFRPTDLVTDDTLLRFGDFAVRFLAVPGHSPSDLLTIIDERFVHVGDALIAANDGTPILPYVPPGALAAHIASLQKLKEFSHCTLLPGHGGPIAAGAEAREAIENRLRYLEAVSRSRSRISYEQATKDCTCEFLYKEWHENFYK